jgi:hypothetical protein
VVRVHVNAVVHWWCGGGGEGAAQNGQCKNRLPSAKGLNGFTMAHINASDRVHMKVPAALRATAGPWPDNSINNSRRARELGGAARVTLGVKVGVAADAHRDALHTPTPPRVWFVHPVGVRAPDQTP